MQHPANGLRRMPLPRTPVNKGATYPKTSRRASSTANFHRTPILRKSVNKASRRSEGVPAARPPLPTGLRTPEVVVGVEVLNIEHLPWREGIREERVHRVVDAVAPKHVGLGLVRHVGGAVVLQPGRPDTVLIAVIEIEDRIIWRRGAEHILTDPHVDAVVKAWGGVRRYPSLHLVAEARRLLVPRWSIVGFQVQCSGDLSPAGQRGSDQ